MEQLKREILGSNFRGNSTATSIYESKEQPWENKSNKLDVILARQNLVNPGKPRENMSAAL
jgi:hypothetical protein